MRTQSVARSAPTSNGAALVLEIGANSLLGPTFLFFTDGLTWKQRKSDLRKLVEFQNNGDITRIYTYALAEQFEADLRELKAEYKL